MVKQPSSSRPTTAKQPLNNSSTTAQRFSPYRLFLKRPFDIVASLLAIILFSPVLLIVALLVRIKLGSPVLFRQKRPGLNEKIFTIYKFRTMTDAKDESGQLLPDGERLTPFGKWLRSTSLDELPELFNVLKGEMSIVGPRPQLVRDMVFMSDKQRERHNASPGLTGWAQLNGRNGISWEEKLALDLDYIGRITFFRDMRIIVLTIAAVLRREGVSADGMATTEDYGASLLKEGQISKHEFSSRLIEARELIENTEQQR